MEPLKAPVNMVSKEEVKAVRTVPLLLIGGIGAPGKPWGVWLQCPKLPELTATSWEES